VKALLAIIAAVLCWGSMALADVNITFENPPYTASGPGVPLAGQDGWFTPPASAGYAAHTYTGNIYNLQPNPTGSQQFTAGISPGGTNAARAQRLHNFATADTWTASWDIAAGFSGVPPTQNSLGGFSLQDSGASRFWQTTNSWVNPAAPAAWNAAYRPFDATGIQAPEPGLFPGPQWQNLQPGRWYRQSTTWSFSTNLIIEVALTDLTTGITTTAHPTGWYLAGGATPALPLPTALRFLTAGGAGNVLGWDNLLLCPFSISGFLPPQAPEGGLVQISGCGFGNNPLNLSVGIDQLGGAIVPMTVVSATDTLIVARVGPVPQGSTPGPITVVRGSGSIALLNPVNRDVIPENPAGLRIWDRAQDPRTATSAQPFLPLFTPPPPESRCFFGTLEDGSIMTSVNGPVAPNTTLRVFAALHTAPIPSGAELQATSIRLRIGGDSQYLAERPRDVIQSAFSSQGINTSCIISVDPNFPAQRRLTLTRLDGIGQPIPSDRAHLIVCVQDPIAINPFPIGPVSAFFSAGLTNLGAAARVDNIGLSGEDGATISPLLPAAGGLRVYTQPIALAQPAESFTLTAWGTVNANPGRLIGRTRLFRNAGTLALFADFTAMAAPQVQVNVYYNTLLVGSATVPAGMVGVIAPGVPGIPTITGCGAAPTSGPTPPFLWIDLDRPALITPTGGTPLQGNHLRIAAIGGPPVTAIAHLDLAAAQTGLDAGNIVIASGVEGGVCYSNCDGSSASPILNVNDFTCFLNAFAAGSPQANCDGSTLAPILNVNDFLCFLNSYSAGCP